MLRLRSRHRIMCGDSTNEDDVAKLMDGEKADMVFTDPPYGINYTSVSVAPELLGSNKKSKNQSILGDENTGVFRKCYESVISNMDCNAVIWGGNYFTDILPVNGHWIVWNKLKFDKPNQNFSHCELAWTNIKKDMVRMYSHSWDGAFREGNKKDECKTRVHPNQKPVGMFSKMFDDLKANTILDLFLGSGSTLIACEKTNRRCYGMELDEHYMSVILKRWEEYTGKKAVRLLDA